MSIKRNKNHSNYILFFCVLIFPVFSCSSDDSSSTNEQIQEELEDDDPIDDPTEELNARFVFNQNLVIEHSWNTSGCDSPPCDTDQDALNNVFNNSLPNDPYFYMEDDIVELNLKCQSEKGRRAEFKQISENSYS